MNSANSPHVTSRRPANTAPATPCGGELVVKAESFAAVSNLAQAALKLQKTHRFRCLLYNASQFGSPVYAGRSGLVKKRAVCLSAAAPGAAPRGSRPAQCALHASGSGSPSSSRSIALVHMRPIAQNLLQAGTRKRSPQPFLGELRKAPIVAVEEPGKVGVEKPVAWQQTPSE